ncbi:MAG: hypothetical protein A2X61_01655 [Ignavibacteria bacterium GWB2_35_12]|nr:MAG: hypothetical protein A2X61_01655 [Ignavibacteria bacterium GWB2_35_12]OGU94930.1 MAG: hypothetical protein A2220_09385 [Ignavibacteria bacterium RIFOXYA2_FULL_35_10]OGV19568.1 MAG: hypothetical protein A2475_07500 [Ignavibacteria bacterium RIFOXYC2_FULL_35_21]
MNVESVKPDYTSISNILQEVSDKRMMLPEFQRPFVWSIEQSKDLFDSLMRGIFIGTFVLAKPQFDLSCREIDIRPRSGKGSRAKVNHNYYKTNDFETAKTYVILDGQQRITAIYRVLKGNDKLYFIFKNPENIPAPNNDIESMEQIIDSLSVKPSEDLFSIELKEVFKCATWKDKEIHQKIFEPLIENYKFLKDNNGLAERYLNLILDLKRLFYNLIQDKTLLSVFFLNMGIEKFCMFFERSNSKGTELSFIDIITAKIYKDFKLDKSINEFKENNRAIIFDNSIVEAFVRYISFLKMGQVDRKTILTSLDGSDFQTYWNEICELYKKSYSFIINQKLIFRNDWVPYKTMYIPIMHFLRNIPHKDFSQITPHQMKLFRFWFWGSLLNTRYGGGMIGSTNDIIVDDCNKLCDVVKGNKFPKDYLKQYKFDFKKEDLIELSSNGAIFTGIMAIMNYKVKNLKNLFNNLDIDFESPINIHHIFPTKYLEKNFDEESFENENVDSILNKMIIERIPNIKFGEKRPSEYLKDITSNPDLIKSLSSHIIPSADKLIKGEFDNNFNKFVDERGEQILEIINDEIGKIKIEFMKEFEN